MESPIKALIASLFVGSAIAAAVSTHLADDCTTVTTVMVDRAPPTPWPVIMTLTEYIATTTVHRELDCHGCNFLKVRTSIVKHGKPSGAPPSSVEVVTKSEPSTFTQYHCSERIWRQGVITKHAERQLIYPTETVPSSSSPSSYPSPASLMEEKDTELEDVGLDKRTLRPPPPLKEAKDTEVKDRGLDKRTLRPPPPLEEEKLTEAKAGELSKRTLRPPPPCFPLGINPCSPRRPLFRKPPHRVPPPLGEEKDTETKDRGRDKADISDFPCLPLSPEPCRHRRPPPPPAAVKEEKGKEPDGRGLDKRTLRPPPPLEEERDIQIKNRGLDKRTLRPPPTLEEEKNTETEDHGLDKRTLRPPSPCFPLGINPCPPRRPPHRRPPPPALKEEKSTESDGLEQDATTGQPTILCHPHHIRPCKRPWQPPLMGEEDLKPQDRGLDTRGVDALAPFKDPLCSDDQGLKLCKNAHPPCTRRILRRPELKFGPTSTVWSRTITTTKIIGCGSCTAVEVDTSGFGVPPSPYSTPPSLPTPPTSTFTRISSRPRLIPLPTVTIEPRAQQSPAPTTLATSTSYPSFWSPPPGTTKTVAAADIDFPICTRRIALPADRPDSTLTIYPSTVTTTSTRFCGTCALIWSTRTIIPLAPVRYIATKIAEKPSVATALTCSSWDIEPLRPTVEPPPDPTPEPTPDPTAAPTPGLRSATNGDSYLAVTDASKEEHDEWVWT
ncbi:hypothetical protein PT974_02331 [Cladobotryum mycophilum]|uniref:Uncharacterized protein n=1 Tax=Cladobotryum mycophilum TaxID=491253 RepID=A0ABR0SY02_9HYPO